MVEMLSGSLNQREEKSIPDSAPEARLCHRAVWSAADIP